MRSIGEPGHLRPSAGALYPVLRLDLGDVQIATRRSRLPRARSRPAAAARIVRKSRQPIPAAGVPPWQTPHTRVPSGLAGDLRRGRSYAGCIVEQRRGLSLK